MMPAGSLFSSMEAAGPRGGDVRQLQVIEGQVECWQTSVNVTMTHIEFQQFPLSLSRINK